MPATLTYDDLAESVIELSHRQNEFCAGRQLTTDETYDLAASYGLDRQAARTVIEVLACNAVVGYDEAQIFLFALELGLILGRLQVKREEGNL